jgi:hypothetical protein
VRKTREYECFTGADTGQDPYLERLDEKGPDTILTSFPDHLFRTLSGLIGGINHFFRVSDHQIPIRQKHCGRGSPLLVLLRPRPFNVYLVSLSPDFRHGLPL